MESGPGGVSSATLTLLMGPMEANGIGSVHGGVVMKLCDEAAALTAMRHARRVCVTVAMDRMTFMQRVWVNEVLTLRASVNAVWRTSLEVGVRVEAENPVTGEQRHTSTAYLTMVALDSDGRPAPVPPLVVESEDAQRRERDAQVRRASRLAERERARDRRA